MQNEDKDEEILNPEIVEEAKGTDLMEKGKGGPLGKTISRFSTMPFYHKIQERRIKSFRVVVQEETGLMRDLDDHAKMKNRLKDVEIEIETEHLERVKRLHQAQKEAREAQLDERLAKKFESEREEIQRLKLEEEKAKLLEQINGIKASPKEENSIERLKKKLREKIKIKEVFQDYEIEKMVLKFKEELRTQQAIDKVFSELGEEILQGRAPNELSEEEAFRYKNLEDFYYKTKDGI